MDRNPSLGGLFFFIRPRLEPRRYQFKMGCLVIQPFPMQRFGMIQVKQPFINVWLWGSRVCTLKCLSLITKRTVWLYLGVLHLGSGCPKMPRRMQVVFCSAMQVGRKIYPPNTWHAVSLKNHLTNIEKTHEYKLISKQMHL